MHTNPSNTLVVLLHGYGLNPKRYASLRETIQETLKPLKILFPIMPIRNRFCTANLYSLVDSLQQQVDAEWAGFNDEQKHSLKIIIIGHSTGALLARKLYVTACGENEDAPFEEEISHKDQRPWAEKVTRLILFAGINKGWTLNPHLSLRLTLWFSLGIIIGKVMRTFGYTPIIFKTRKGAPFITQLRLQSLSMYEQVQKKTKNVGDALTVQLLGSMDSIVSPEDDVDLVSGNSFVYLDIPYSNHEQVLDMTGDKGKLRKELVVKALVAGKESLQAEEVLPSDTRMISQDRDVTDVVFVVHGIRDTAYWTQKVARKVKKLGEKDGKRIYATETSTYGYFSMLSFLMSRHRRQKVEWLMDQYTENKALYPNAKFSFIGHSHGTYLLAKALQDYPACSFKSIVLAGSVIKKDFRWDHYIGQSRISSIYNLIATNDLVVGIFPKTLQALRLQDLGSGGYDGFTNLPDNDQLRCITGGHGAAVVEDFWDELAYLCVYGQPSGRLLKRRQQRSYPVKLVGSMPVLTFGILVAIVVGIGCLIYICVPGIGWKITWTLVYVTGLYKLLSWY